MFSLCRLDSKNRGRGSMNSDPKAAESDTDSMAEYGEGDTGKFFLQTFILCNNLCCESLLFLSFKLVCDSALIVSALDILKLFKYVCCYVFRFVSHLYAYFLSFFVHCVVKFTCSIFLCIFI